MPVYPFYCVKCKAKKELYWPIEAYDSLPVPQCHGSMEQVPVAVGIKLAPTIGRDSGFYDLDYGKRATEDLTPPGKYNRMFKDGEVKNQFWEADVAAGKRKRDGTKL